MTMPTDRENTISRWAVAGALDSNDSATRKMFELGIRLRRESTAPVYDLSLGNPHLEPPTLWRDAVVHMLQTEPPGLHRYMPNAGFPFVREFIAGRESDRLGVPVTAEDIVMTVGAAGAMAIAFRSVLDPGDEVVIPAPYFPDYTHYCRAVDATLVGVNTTPNFGLDLAAIERAITEKTRVIIINSPNNPTGALYSEAELAGLAAILKKSSAARSRPIYVVEDSPYRDLVYDGTPAASIFKYYDDVIHISSHSKDLGLAGERIGFAVISPRSPGRALLRRALTFANRVLGFVSAPAIMQRALPLVLGKPGGRVDTGVYATNANVVTAALRPLGFHIVDPLGGLFLFPRLPNRWIEGFGERAGAELADRLAERRTLVVPGSAFGAPTHIRIALCVDIPEIEGALESFRIVCADFAKESPPISRGHDGSSGPRV